MRCSRCGVDRDASLFTEGAKVYKQCATCRKNGRARFKRAWEKAPDKVRASIKRWRKANPERYKAITKRARKAYWKRWPQKKAAKNRDWNRRNRGRKTAHVRAYQLTKARAMPKWADREAIELIYILARQLRAEGYDVHVDHVYPLRGKDVCGLHVDANLQIVPKPYNVRKGNKVKAHS